MLNVNGKYRKGGKTVEMIENELVMFQTKAIQILKWIFAST